MDENLKPVSVELSLPKMRCLIVDDDPSFLEGVRTFLSSQGYDVDLAQSPEEAVKILAETDERKYQLVIVDVNFGALSTMHGDDFVLNNRELFGKAKKVIISAGEWLSSRRHELRNAGVVFVEKSNKLSEVLDSITKEENQRRINELGSIVTNELVPRIKEVTGQQVSMKLASAKADSSLASDAIFATLKQTLIRFLMSGTEQDKPILYYDQKIYSAKQLAWEVENETEVGLDQVKMLINEFDSFLRVD